MEDSDNVSNGGALKPSSLDAQGPMDRSSLGSREPETLPHEEPTRKRERGTGTNEVESSEVTSKKRSKTDGEDLRERPAASNIMSPVVTRTRSRALGKRTVHEEPTHSGSPSTIQERRPRDVPCRGNPDHVPVVHNRKMSPHIGPDPKQ